MKKWILFMVGICISIIALSGSAHPCSSERTQGLQVNQYSLEEMRVMAVNALNSDFYMEADDGSWADVIFVKETPLYDLNNNLTSYCFDLRCNEQKAYIVISADSTHYPVRQFSNHATSVYMNMGEEETPMYCGPGAYYQRNGNESVQNILTSETVAISDIEVPSIASSSENEVCDYRAVAELYISGDILNQPVAQSDSTYKKLDGLIP